MDLHSLAPLALTGSAAFEPVLVVGDSLAIGTLVASRLKRTKGVLKRARELYEQGDPSGSVDALKQAGLADKEAPACLEGELLAAKARLVGGRAKEGVEHAGAAKEIAEALVASHTTGGSGGGGGGGRDGATSSGGDAASLASERALVAALGASRELYSSFSEVLALHTDLNETTCDDALVNTANLLFSELSYNSFYERAPFHRCTWDITGGGTYVACSDKQVRDGCGPHPWSPPMEPPLESPNGDPLSSPPL